MFHPRIILLAVANPLIWLTTPSLLAQLTLSASAPSITQSFNKTDGKLFPAAVLEWTDNVTFPGWFALANDKPATHYRTTSGSSTSLNPPIWVLRNDGNNAALGLVRGEHKSREIWGTLGAYFKNGTEKPITTLKISYTGQQWAQNTGGADRLDVQLSTTAASLTQKEKGTWIDIPELAFHFPKSGAPQFEAIDGTARPNTQKLTATIKLDTPIEPGSTFWLRWLDFKAPGGNQVLAIDDFSLTAIGE